MFEVNGQRKKGRLKRTWKGTAVKESMNVAWSREDVFCQSTWIVSVNRIATRLSRIWPPSLIGNTTEYYTLVSLICHVLI